MPAGHRLSSRNVQGCGWHKRGYREYGELYFQLKRSYANFSRDCCVNEYETVADLLKRMLHSLHWEDPGPLDGDLHYEFYYRRELLEPSEQMVCRIMDGGETIYAKIFDEDGYEYEYGYEMVQKDTRRPKPRVLVYREGFPDEPFWALEENYPD